MKIALKTDVLIVVILFSICAASMGDNIFSVVNSSSRYIAAFDSQGNLYLKGSLNESSTHTANGNDEFRIQSSDSNDILIIDINNGNMYLSGEIFQNQSTLTPFGTHNFIMQDANGLTVAYVDPNGNLYLKGTLSEQAFIPVGLFSILDSSGNNIAIVDASGNLHIKGVLDESTTHAANSNDEFRMQSSYGSDLLIIDTNDGNTYLSGEIYENQTTLMPSGTNNFIIQDSNGNTVGYIDDPNGNLYLKGTLYEHAF